MIIEIGTNITIVFFYLYNSIIFLQYYDFKTVKTYQQR